MKPLLRFPACCLFILILFFLSPNLYAQTTFDFNANCQQAYQQIIQLRLNSGQQLLDIEKKTNPDNLIPYFLENYVDFFVLFFNEDPVEYKLRKDNQDKRLKLMNQGPVASPFYLFTKSVIHFQWAAIKIKFGYNWEAGWEFRRSFLQSKENQRQFPSFSPDAMLHASMMVVAGTIPDGYKWLGNLLGIKGSIREGMRELEAFLGQGDSWAILFRGEGVFYWLYLKFFMENKKEAVFAFIEKNKADWKNNQLLGFMVANLALNNQQSAYAKDVLLQRNDSKDYLQTPVWDLELGFATFNHLEPSANIYLERFVREFKGKFYLTEVMQKLSWYYYLRDDPASAQSWRQAVLDKGSTDTEADKQALQEARSGRWPQKLLLRARLLNDGGYYEEALQLLVGKNPSDFLVPEEKTEFCYRMARIYDDLGRKADALRFYLLAIQLGDHQKEYFAARAALQAGYIYEKNQDPLTAIGFFQKCIAMKDHEYKNSLDQKAKAGIARCKGD